jgi:hypothetical protein
MLKLFILSVITEKAAFIKSNFFYILETNFYHSNFSFNYTLSLEVLPESLLTIFIFYSLVNLFNDKMTILFQYFK